MLQAPRGRHVRADADGLDSAEQLLLRATRTFSLCRQNPRAAGSFFSQAVEKHALSVGAATDAQLLTKSSFHFIYFLI